MSFSLRTKVFMPLLVLITMLIGYLYLYWMPRSLANMERRCREATERHLESVVEGVVPLLLGRELDTIYANFDALLKKNRDWIGIRLTDPAGRTLYPLEDVPPPRQAGDAQKVRELITPINYLEMNLGTLAVTVDFAPHLAELKGEINHAVSVMLGMIVVILISIGIVLEKKAVKPVKALGSAARELAEGRFGALLPRAGDDEVGRLVDSFDTMRQNLASSYDLLSQSEQKNRAITTTANDAIIMMDERGRVSFWNPAAEGIFGYAEQEVLGRGLHDLVMPDRYGDSCRRGMEEFSRTGAGKAVGRTVEMTARRKDGSEFPVELSLSALRMKDGWHAVGIVRDITGRKEAEGRLLASLEEKGVLLQEVHHRVKNNMQVIISLLDLQLDSLAGRDPREVFSEIRNRIKTMSLVHEKLYLSRDLLSVDFHDYLSTLVDYLYKSYDVSLRKVKLDLDITDISLGIDTAIPCGLIVNELVTNCFKYAFPGERTGEVLVALRKVGVGEKGENEYELMVKDNGVGIPAGLDLKEVKTLGLHLVTTLVQHQLLGSVEIDRTGGTAFHIRFRELKAKRRV